MLRWLLYPVILCLAVSVQTPLSAQEQLVGHTLSFPRKHNQYVRVSTTRPVAASHVEVSMPSWTPGSYLIRDFAADLESLSAYGPDGGSLPVRKMAKNRWRIETEGIPEVRIEYDVWAGSLGVADSWVESGIALLNGASLFLYEETTRSWAQSVDVRLPDDWSQVHSSMRREPGTDRFLASDYDELVDSPIVAGNTRVRDFEVNGRPYALVLSGENRLWDEQKAADDVARIVGAQQEFWGFDPFDRKYLFFNLFMGKFGGLEHDHSTVMMCSPWQMRGRGDYIKWLGLVSHEFFHSWNVRRMRPQALDEFNYDREVYTRELWLAEGLTSYYDNLLVFRAGLIDVADYFELLSEEFRVYETTPGREIRSAELASFDTWIKQYRQDSNKSNNSISYYRKGAIIGFVTDTAIRRETNNKASLDDVMRAMFARYGDRASGQRGYPPGAFESEVEAVAGPDVRKQVEEMLRSTTDPAIDEALAWYGLSLDRGQGTEAGEGANEPALAGVGVKWDSSGRALLAAEVVQGFAGAEAGILPGDELLAIDGIRVTTDDFQSFFQKFEPGEEVDLTLVRHGRLITLPVNLQNEIADLYVIRPASKLRNRDIGRLEAWLGRELKFVR